MKARNPINRTRQLLMRWFIDSSIERGGEIPLWIQARMSRDVGLARYVRSARDVDRQLRRGAVQFQPAGANELKRNTAEVCSDFKRSSLTPWRARLAAAASLVLLVCAAALLTRQHNPGETAESRTEVAGSPSRVVLKASGLEALASPQLSELLDRTRGALETDRLPLVLEARRLAHDGREFGRHLLAQLPVRPVAFIKARDLDATESAPREVDGDQRSGA